MNAFQVVKKQNMIMDIGTLVVGIVQQTNSNIQLDRLKNICHGLLALSTL